MAPGFSAGIGNHLLRQSAVRDVAGKQIPARGARGQRGRQLAPGLTMTLPFMFGWIEHT
jgi:hypothetical protein